jgi:hypothetical protein
VNKHDETWDALVADYLRQVNKALAAAGHPARKTILEDVRSHLDQRYGELAPEERNWDGYQAAITQMGPPSDYAELLGMATLRRRVVTWRRIAIVLPLALLALAAAVYKGYIPLGLYEGPRSYPLPGEPLQVPFEPDPQLVGRWTSVDFVRLPSQFDPAHASWPGELWLTTLDFGPAGELLGSVGSNDGRGAARAWMNWGWTKDWILSRDNNIRAQYQIKQVNDHKYLFFPWLSGDVTLRKLKPMYYVLKAEAPKR